MSHPTPALPEPATEYHGPPPAQKGNGLAVTALVLGIFTLVICLIPVVNNVAYFTGIAAIVLGFIARRGLRPSKGMALAGIITAVIGIIGAIISTIIYLTVLNGVSDAIDSAGKSVAKAESSASSSTTTDSSPVVTEDSGDTPADTETTPADSGPATFAVGDGATISQDGVDNAATLKVTQVKVYTRAIGSYAEKPQKGTYKMVYVSVKNTGSDSFHVNPYDFYYRDAKGNHYEYGDGNYSGFEGDELNDTNLAKGEKTSGVIIFDVPAKATQFVYSPNSDSEPIGIWKTK